MWILPLIGYVGVVIGFCFLVLAIASGLYYLSELVEEHTVVAKKLLTRLIYAICALHVLLVVFDGFPFLLSLLGIVSHMVYAGNLRRFPIVKLGDSLFILSCVLVITNHILWFRHFSSPPRHSVPTTPRGGAPPRHRADYNSPSPLPQIPTFTEVASYFGLCVWFVPFALFVSLSAGDNVLPSMGSEYATGSADIGLGSGVPRGGGAKKKGLAKAAVDWVREWGTDIGRAVGWSGQEERMKGY